MKFCLNRRKYFFTARAVEHWHRWSREAVESPSPESVKAQLDKILGNLFYLTLLEQRGGLDNPEMLLRTSTIL